MRPGKAVIVLAALGLTCCTLQTDVGEGCPRDCEGARVVCADSCADDELCVEACAVNADVCLDECSE